MPTPRREIIFKFGALSMTSLVIFSKDVYKRQEDSSLVKTVPLDEICRRQQVHDGCFASLGQVPKTAVTLTVPALTAAPYLFCTVPSKTKRAAVNAAVNGEISVDCPASVLRRCQNAVLYCDGESGQDLL